MSRTFDVVVVGGGPSGSTAARECATSGMSVVLVDKAEFPRDKPCGGGVTIRCLRLLPFGIESVSERPITGVRFSAPGARINRMATEPLTFLTQRRYLDTYLLEQAEKAGVEIHQRSALRDIERARGKYHVRAGDELIEAQYLIAADGANGPTARSLGARVATWKGIALEGNITVGSMPSPWTSSIGVDFGHIRGGYGWLFPKGDHVNIGLGGWKGNGPTLRSLLDRLVRWYGFNPADLWNLRGHPLPVRRPGASFGSDRALFVGDAAGLLDPFTGEGIYAAIWSGRQAAVRIRDAFDGGELALAAYASDVRQRLLPDLRVGRKLADLFHLAPWLWTQGIRSRPIWDVACRLLTGEQGYASASVDAGWKSSMLSGMYESAKLLSRSLPSSRRPLLYAG